MDRESWSIAFLQEKFPRISMEKLKTGIFNGPQIRDLMEESMFDKALSEADLFAWYSLKSVIKNFLGNHWSVEYEKETEELLKSVNQPGARMTVKLNFLRSHLDYFSKNCGDLNQEQDERFHQNIYIMEERYQEWWDVNFLADTTGAWNGMRWLPSIGWCPWKDISSLNRFSCVCFSLLWHNVSFQQLYQP